MAFSKRKVIFQLHQVSVAKLLLVSGQGIVDVTTCWRKKHISPCHKRHYEEYNQMHRCHLRPKHLRQSHPESLQQKVQQAKARPENFWRSVWSSHFLFHGCFFCHKKNGTCIFCCRFSVLEVAGTAPKPPQTYAERLQILDRMRMVREYTGLLEMLVYPPLASQSVSFANFQLLWSWTYQCIIYPILEEPPFFSLKTIFPWQFMDEKPPFLHRFFRLHLRRLLAKYPGFVGSGVDMPSHAWQWTNEELELFIGNFGSKLQRGWGFVGVELSWVGLGSFETLLVEELQ